MDKINYTYKSIPIYGGGYVTGLLFHPKNANKLYMRTDIGGLYRYSFENEEWTALNDDADIEHLAQTYPLSMAVSDRDESLLVSVCGEHKEGTSYLCISHDCGDSFKLMPLPEGCNVHGNSPGRSTGERLLIDGERIYFASMTAGLIYTDDYGKGYKSAEAQDKNCTLIAKHGEVYLLGTSGDGGMKESTRGCTLYYSTDGTKYSPLPIPEPAPSECCSFAGFVPHRCTYDGEYVYVSFSQGGLVRWGGADAYSCDTGSLSGGRVMRYKFEGGRLSEWKDITPDYCREQGGYGGIDCANGRLYVCTLCGERGDRIYVSENQGEDWKICLGEGIRGDFNWTVGHMEPKYSGGHWCIHWMSDLKISPQNPDLAVFNTGCGVFATKNLSSENPLFEPMCSGLEETVHLALMSPPSGDYHLIDMLGDLGGYIFDDMDKPSERMLCDDSFNRWVSCSSADFAEKDPSMIVAAPSGNWAGTTRGGLILSHDSGRSWARLPSPSGFSDEVDRLLENEGEGNRPIGGCAVTADGKRIFRSVGFRYCSTDAVFYTDSESEDWVKCRFDRQDMVRIFTDRQDPTLVIAVSEDYQIYESHDKGESFTHLLDTGIAHGDRRRCEELRMNPQSSGELWIANGVDGLYRVDCWGLWTENLLPSDSYARCVGFGRDEIFICGRIGGEVGLFRSRDGGKRWVQINDSAHQFGDIRSVCGDPRVRGRVYLATGSRGLIYASEQ